MGKRKVLGGFVGAAEEDPLAWWILTDLIATGGPKIVKFTLIMIFASSALFCGCAMSDHSNALPEGQHMHSGMDWYIEHGLVEWKTNIVTTNSGWRLKS